MTSLARSSYFNRAFGRARGCGRGARAGETGASGASSSVELESARETHEKEPRTAGRPGGRGGQRVGGSDPGIGRLAPPNPRSRLFPAFGGRSRPRVDVRSGKNYEGVHHENVYSETTE